jgi:nitroreductase
MNTLEAIAQRRSIRKYKEAPVPDELIEKVLTAATQAPSGMNRQPWHFVVVKEDKRMEMTRLMREGIQKAKDAGINIASSPGTARIMDLAPVTIFVFNTDRLNEDQGWTPIDRIMNVMDVQSIGAAIQNMLLAAHELGLGALWIGDVFYAYDELCAWMGETHQMIAAVALGYPDEEPPARPRKAVDDVTTWL